MAIVVPLLNYLVGRLVVTYDMINVTPGSRTSCTSKTYAHLAKLSRYVLTLSFTSRILLLKLLPMFNIYRSKTRRPRIEMPWIEKDLLYVPLAQTEEGNESTQSASDETTWPRQSLLRQTRRDVSRRVCAMSTGFFAVLSLVLAVLYTKLLLSVRHDIPSHGSFSHGFQTEMSNHNLKKWQGSQDCGRLTNANRQRFRSNRNRESHIHWRAKVRRQRSNVPNH